MQRHTLYQKYVKGEKGLTQTFLILILQDSFTEHCLFLTFPEQNITNWKYNRLSKYYGQCM